VTRRPAEFQTSAFGYLIIRGARNRLMSRLRRAKNPRYALAMLIGASYFYFVYLRPQWQRGSTHRPPGIDTGGPMLLVIGTAVLLVMAAIAWFADNGPSNLALDKAEAAFILPAPVSRRALVSYKLLRAQLAVLTTVLVWTILIRRGSSTLPAPMRAIGVWILFTTTNLHRTGAEIVKAAWRVRGRGALRKHWAAIAVIILTILGLSVSIGMSYPTLSAAWAVGVKDWLVAFGAAVGTGPSHIALWPIQATLAPMVAATASGWWSALPGALIVLLVHLIWVTRVDDDAVTAAVDRATQRIESIRERADERKSSIRAIKPKPEIVLKTMPLSPVGWPPMAIVWKNALAMRRRTRNGVTLFLIMALLPTGIGLLVTMDGGSRAVAAALWGAIFAAETALAGPLVLRNDLRSDMINLTALKLLPLSGRTIVAAEVLSAVAPLAVIEGVMLVFAAVALQFSPRAFLDSAGMALVLLAVLPTLVVVNTAFIAIQNAAPVLFPAWTKLDALRSGGMEAMGQMVIVLALIVLLMAAMLLVPVTLGVGVIFLGHAHLGAAVSAALLLGSVALALEVAALILVLGRTFDRTEPAEIAG
jgi:ABC-2 type transport system permease protein